MSGFILSVILILVVIFLIVSLDAILSRRISYVVTETEYFENCIEAQIRLMLKQNPNSEILLIDKTQSEETEKILSILSQDFPQIHIIKADSN